MKKIVVVAALVCAFAVTGQLWAQERVEIAEHVKVIGIKSMALTPGLKQGEQCFHIFARLQSSYDRKIVVDKCKFTIKLSAVRNPAAETEAEAAGKPAITPIELGVADCASIVLPATSQFASFTDVELTVLYPDFTTASAVLVQVFNLVGDPSNNMEVSIESLETGTEVWVYKKDPKTPAEEKMRTGVDVRFNWFFEPKIQRTLLFQ